MEHLLAIDQGTSATKCVLVDRAGSIVAKASVPLDESYPAPGWVEQSAEAIWRSVQCAVAQCLAQRQGLRVAAVGLSTQRESALLWRRADGQALTPLLSWQDRRTAALCAQLAAQGGADLARERSGLPLDPMFSALKMRWLLDRIDPDRQASRHGELRAGTVDAWLLARMGAGDAIEVGNASRTQLLNVRTGDWDHELLRLFGIPPSVLPRVVASCALRGDAGGLHPVLAGVPVRAVMADSHAALFAHGVQAPGDVKATMGTGCSVMGLVPPSGPMPRGLCLTVAWDAGQGPLLAVEGNIRSAGATMRWMGGLFGLDADSAAEEAGGVQADGLCLVPAFNGLGAPHWDADAVGLVSGLTLATTRGQLLAAALDSMAHQIADVLEVMDAHAGRAMRLLVDGGASRNPVLRRRLADYIGRPVVHCIDPELSALGVAHLAGVGADLWDMAALRSLPRARQAMAAPPSALAERPHGARMAWRQAVARSRLGDVRPLHGEHS